MSAETYKLIHLAGLILAFLGLGGVLLAPRGSNRAPFPMILHGVGMLALLVAGFGMLARMEITGAWPGWIYVKVVCWLLLGVLPVLHRKGKLPAAIGWVAAAVIGFTAAYMAIMKTF